MSETGDPLPRRRRLKAPAIGHVIGSGANGRSRCRPRRCRARAENPYAGATIVEGEDAPAVVDDEDRTMATVHNEPPLSLQLLKAPREREFLVRRVHEQTSRQLSLWERCRYSDAIIQVCRAALHGLHS